MNPENLSCETLKDKKYRELCSRLSKKYDKKFIGSAAEIVFPKSSIFPPPPKIRKDAFTSIKDVDMKILNEMEDEDLSNACIINKYVYSLCQDEIFWMNRYLSKYEKFFEFESSGDRLTELKKWKGNASWKEFYLWTANLINDPNPYFISANAMDSKRFDIVGLLFNMKDVLVGESDSAYGAIGQLKFYFRFHKGFKLKDFDHDAIRDSINFPRDAEGLATFTANNGSFRKTYFLNGKKEGESISYYPNGKIAEIFRYHDGKLIEKPIFYHFDGKRALRSQWNGVPNNDIIYAF